MLGAGAASQGQRDRGNDCHGQHHRSHFERHQVIGEHRLADPFQIRDAGGKRRIRRIDQLTEALHADQRDHLQRHHDGRHDGNGQVLGKTLAQGIDVNVEHHHHEQEQHHHRAYVDQHQCDGEELGIQQ